MSALKIDQLGENACLPNFEAKPKHVITNPQKNLMNLDPTKEAGPTLTRKQQDARAKLEKRKAETPEEARARKDKRNQRGREQRRQKQRETANTSQVPKPQSTENVPPVPLSAAEIEEIVKKLRRAVNVCMSNVCGVCDEFANVVQTYSFQTINKSLLAKMKEILTFPSDTPEQLKKEYTCELDWLSFIAK